MISVSQENGFVNLMIRRTVASGLVMCVAIGANGCAVGRYGTVAAHVTHLHDATQLAVHSLGLHLRTRNDDSGVHIGYAQRIYVFPAIENLSAGWHFLVVPLPEQDSFAQDLSTYGVDLMLSAPDRSLSLGYARTQLLSRVPWNADVLIEYANPGLRAVTIKTCSEMTPCIRH